MYTKHINSRSVIDLSSQNHATGHATILSKNNSKDNIKSYNSPETIYSELGSSDDTFLVESNHITEETIFLLNQYINKLQFENQVLSKERSIQSTNKITIEYNLERIDRIRSHLNIICKHDWEDDYIDSINGLVKFTYCKICELTL